MESPIWIRRHALQQRWGDMPTSTFYDRLKKGLIPPAEYPFGPHMPHWRLAVIEAHERQSERAAA
jgi:hypothetical protein